MSDEQHGQSGRAGTRQTTSGRKPRGKALPWAKGVESRDLPNTTIHDVGKVTVRDIQGDYPLRWVRRSEGDVASSWLRQVTVLDDGGVRVRLQARLSEPAFGGVTGDQFADRPTPKWPLVAPLFVLGAVRGPAVVYQDEATASQEEIIRQLTLYEVGARAARTLERSHEWAEPCVIAYPDPDHRRDDWSERVLDIALQMGIETLVQITDGSWKVQTFTTAPTHKFVTTMGVPASITRDVEHRCPMKAFPRRGEYCQMRGGPWTSSAITAAAGWRDRRDLLVDSLGCDTCEGTRYLFQGTVRTGGGPVAVVPSPVPTRWLRADESALRQANAHD